MRNVKEATSSRLKLKHYLILASRLLFIFFLVLTFAQPYIPGEDNNQGPQSGGAGKTVYLYLDNSLSMSSEIASNLSGLDLGINYIREIIQLNPQNTRYKLLTNDFTNFSRVPKNPGELEDQITEINLSNISRSFEEVHGKIRNDMETSNLDGMETNAPEIYWISDFQKSTAGNLEALDVDTTEDISIIPVESSFNANVFVDSVYLANPLLLAEQNNEIAVELRNVGDEPVNDQIVKLIINDRQVANASTDIPANGKSQFTFNLNFPLEDINRCHLEFEDFPVAFDNDFYFTLNVSEKISVLEIRPGSFEGNAGSTIGKVFGNEDIFNFASHSIDNIDYSVISEADLMVLNETGNELTNQSNIAILPYLKDFVENGGHLLYIPPPNGNITLLGKILGRNNLVTDSGQDGYRLVPASDAANDSVESNQVPLANPDFDRPFFEDMFESEEEFEMPRARKIINPSLRGEAMLSYQTGEPFLLRLSQSELPNLDAGNIFMFSSPVRDDYTDIYRHAIFVPVMYRLASLSKSVNNSLFYYIDQSVISLESFGDQNLGEENVQRNQVGNRSLFKMVQDEQELIPGQRVVGNRLIMEIPNNVLNPGFYNLLPRDNADFGNDEENNLIETLSFNINKQESFIEQYKSNELTNIFGDYKNVNIFEPSTDVSDFNRQLKNRSTGTALWKYALILALTFLLAEIFLIRFL